MMFYVIKNLVEYIQQATHMNRGTPKRGDRKENKQTNKIREEPNLRKRHFN